jgi:hypothetical protein
LNETYMQLECIYETRLIATSHVFGVICGHCHIWYVAIGTHIFVSQILRLL